MVGDDASSAIQSRRMVMKRALRASAYSAPLIIAATTAGPVAAASPAPAGGVFAVTVTQEPPDEICEGPGLPTPVAMPVGLAGSLTGATPNQKLDIYVLPMTFIPPAAPTTFTKIGTITTSGTGAATIDGDVVISIPAQKIATATVNLVPFGAAPTSALYSKTVMVLTFCD